MTSKTIKTIGLMSGTSLDGIDAALIETDGEHILNLGPTFSRSYDPAEQDLLRRALTAAARLANREERPAPLDQAEELITLAHAAAVRELLETNGVEASAISAVGFHGQTVLHRPELGFTVQLGDGQRLANMLGIEVVYDLRASDVAAGGQGAPLVPIFHKALADTAELPRPLCVLNIGGVANVTWIGADGELIAFDTGPGNALIDDWVRRHTGEPYDDGGRLARQGVVDRKTLEALLAHPYFRKHPPKSLDRNCFSLSGPAENLSAADGAATLTAFTAGAAMLARKHFPQQPAMWIVVGGGARNAALIGTLKSLLRTPVKLAEEVGWAAQHVEAQAFAFLAARSRKGLPLTFPGTTGAPYPLTGGVWVKPQPGSVS
jgi:anhydro-N-acetylmuramic acid kinase